MNNVRYVIHSIDYVLMCHGYAKECSHNSATTIVEGNNITQFACRIIAKKLI